MNILFTKPSLQQALVSGAMSANCLNAEVTAAGIGQRIEITSATDAELWAARLDAVAAWSPPASADEFRVMAVALRASRFGAAGKPACLSCCEPVHGFIYEWGGHYFCNRDCVRDYEYATGRPIHRSQLNNTQLSDAPADCLEGQLDAALKSADAADRARMQRGGK